MNRKIIVYTLTLVMMGLLPSCVSKKKFAGLQDQLKSSQSLLAECDAKSADYLKRYNACEAEKERIQSDTKISKQYKEEQINDLKAQIADLKSQRDQQVDVVGDLTVLSKSANDNIKETLSQLESKDKYIRYIQAARTKADSINLALAVNLKGVLKQGLADEDVEVKVDKTVVFINLSDKMLYNSGSAVLTSRANEVLGKIASILQSRPDFEVMVEGYTDNQPINSTCIADNWDLSVKRSTAVVRKLQKDFNIDPNRLIAAGRGEYNALASNSTVEGRSTNRRTRIIIMPKLDQFYDLLNPDKAAATLK